jgi:protein gp37
MADGSKIEWTDATWNPVTGCSVVSPGCTNCYAMKLAGTRMKHHPSRAGLAEPSKAGPVWNGQVRFVSAEPLLGAIDLMAGSAEFKAACQRANVRGEKIPRLDWVIAGGESGPDARPMHPDWVRSLRDQCAAAGVPYFFKQWGEWVGGNYTGDFANASVTGARGERCALHDFGAGVFAARVGKKAAGATLDGCEHRAFPE